MKVNHLNFNYLYLILYLIFDINCMNLGFDGGLPANFLMELYDAEKMELKYQVTNKVPVFEVSSLDPGVPIKLYLYAENAKGTSDPAIIDDSAQNQQRLGVEGRKEKQGEYIILAPKGALEVQMSI